MDDRLEQWINAPAGTHPTLDSLMRHAATWAEPAFVALIVVWFLIGWVHGKAWDRQGAITAAAAPALALLTNQVITHLWQRNRPFVAHPQTVHVLLAHSHDPSFPSDHAAPAFAIAVALVIIHRRLGLLVLLGAIVMSYARVYCGDHYPADVLAGALIGSVIAGLLTTRLGGVMAAMEPSRIVGPSRSRKPVTPPGSWVVAVPWELMPAIPAEAPVPAVPTPMRPTATSTIVTTQVSVPSIPSTPATRETATGSCSLALAIVGGTPCPRATATAPRRARSPAAC